MPPVRRLLAVLFTVVIAGTLMSTGASADLRSSTRADIDPWLVSAMKFADHGATHAVVVHGSDIRRARAAALHAGLSPLHDLEQIGATIAVGDRRAILRVSRTDGVVYVEGNRPLAFFLDHSHHATRGHEASRLWRARRGVTLDGRGVSVAVIDSGVDATHPFLRRSTGESVVVANLKNVCGVVAPDPDMCFVDAGGNADTDTAAAGGHGTHVNGIIAGQPIQLSDDTRLVGAAPGARLVSLSVGAAKLSINAELAMEWVLEHHPAPCGENVSRVQCPPIKVINNSWGPIGGGEFDARSAIAKLQRRLVTAGVVTVWANGNDGGNGTVNYSNPPAQDPRGGIISVASYFDYNTGSRRGELSTFSSRGARTRPATWPDISAPGEDIVSSCRPYLHSCSFGAESHSGSGLLEQGAFSTMSGTSMAAPHVSGIVAQLFQSKRAATPAQIERSLKSTGHRYAYGASYRRTGRYLTSFDKGVGLVDVVAAVRSLQLATK